MKKKRVLAFVDMERGRDADILIPMAYILDKYLDSEVVFKNKYDAHAIFRYKPDLVLLPNSIGSPFYFKISRYAHENNIPCFALVSEGNYWTNGTYDIFGSNTDRKFYHPYGCYWNKRTIAYNLQKHPELKDFFVLTGGIQFDRYKNYTFPTKKIFLEKYGLEGFNKVIGYAAWGFGKLFNKQTLKDNRFVRPNDPNRIEWMKQFMYKVEDTLRLLIENNPDILFILKKHPNESLPSDTGKTINEIENFKEYKNVLYLIHEDISHILNACDIWMGFDTTTVMEAWLIKNSPTFLLHTHHDFFRDDMYKGSIIIDSFSKLQQYINEYYTTGDIQEFQSLKSIRKEIINNIIGFSDGLNHVRAGVYLKKVMETIPAKEKQVKVKLNLLYLLRYWIISLLLPFYKKKLFLMLPKLNKAIWIFENWKMDRLESNRKLYYKYLDLTHHKHSIGLLLENPDQVEKLLSGNMESN